jgi:hypothetical protein
MPVSNTGPALALGVWAGAVSPAPLLARLAAIAAFNCLAYASSTTLARDSASSRESAAARALAPAASCSARERESATASDTSASSSRLLTLNHRCTCPGTPVSVWRHARTPVCLHVYKGCTHTAFVCMHNGMHASKQIIQLLFEHKRNASRNATQAKALPSQITAETSDVLQLASTPPQLASVGP